MSTVPSVPLLPPYPWFGGKRGAASLIWQAIGDCPNVVVPFAGGLGDLLGRPTEPRREVVNDLDGYVVNFWRAVRSAPEEVWYWADDMVSEVDLHSRHQWLVEQRELRQKLQADPLWYDAKVAGWWVWGLCAWIGAGWCNTAAKRLPRSIPRSSPGGIHRLALSDIVALSKRMRRVQVVCGDWSRVLTRAYLTGSGKGESAAILDPPYSEGADGLYTDHDKTVSARVREWALENGDDPTKRIVLCGYEGEHVMPKRWRCVPWKARGGYGRTRRSGAPNENNKRERLWLSPHCLT